MAGIENNWFAGIDPIRRMFETRGRGTVLGEPGLLIAKLPDALGGDSKQQRLLAAPAKGTPGFFALLAAKAHFLMLPKRIVEFLRESNRVDFSEAEPSPGGDAETLERSSLTRGRWAEMRIPGASDGLAWAGSDFGRDPSVHPPRYLIVGRVYHELTHSLLWLQEYASTDIQALYSKGELAYGSARGSSGKTLPAHSAFSEAAGFYAADRIYRWCRALARLNSLMLKPPEDPESGRVQLQWIEDDYDKYEPLYGVVEGDRIASPALSPELREAIDRHILDGLPLTQPFGDTALSGLRSSLLLR